MALEHFTAKFGKSQGTLDQIDIRTLPVRTIWVSYAGHCSPDAIRTHFKARKGYPPQYVIRSQYTILAGPVLDDKKRTRYS